MAVSEIQGRRQKLIKVLQGKIMNADYEYEKEKERTDTVRSLQAQAQLKGTQPVSDVKAEKNGKLKTQQLDLANNELDIKEKRAKNDLAQLKDLDLCTYRNAEEAEGILEEIEKNYTKELSQVKKTDADFEGKHLTKFLKSRESQSFVQIASSVKERVSIFGIYDAVNKQQQTQIKLNCLKKQL